MDAVNPAIRDCLAAGGGVATTAELLARVSWSAVNWARRAGHIVRVQPQVFASATETRDTTVRVRATLAWSRMADRDAPRPALATGPAALVLWGLPSPDGGPVHLEVPASSPLRSRPGVVVRRMVSVGAPRTIDGMPVVSRERALVSSWPVLVGAEQRAPFFAALRERSTTVARIRAELRGWPRLRGRGDLQAFLDILEDGCDSELEYVARIEVFTGPEFERIDWQHRIEHPRGRFRVDGYDEETRTAIELDGDAYHSTRRQRSYDARRTRYLGELGIRVVRFHRDDIVFRGAECRSQLRAILGAARPSGRNM